MGIWYEKQSQRLRGVSPFSGGEAPRFLTGPEEGPGPGVSSGRVELGLVLFPLASRTPPRVPSVGSHREPGRTRATLPYWLWAPAPCEIGRFLGKAPAHKLSPSSSEPQLSQARFYFCCLFAFSQGLYDVQKLCVYISSWFCLAS